MNGLLNTIKAVIFDLDGVLLDSQPVHFKTDLSVLARCGVDLTQEALERYAGTPNKDRWGMFKRDFNLSQSVDALISMHTDILNNILETETLPVVAGIPAILTKIKNAGLKTAVASSSSREFVSKVLDTAGLLPYFDALICGNDVLNGKPAPDIFLKAAKTLNAAPSECIIFEDSANGIAAAAAAGIICIAYRNKTSGRQDLSKAQEIIDSFSDYYTIKKYIML